MYAHICRNIWIH